MKHPNKRLLASIKIIDWFNQLNPNNLILTNLFELDFLTHFQGSIIVVKQIRELQGGDASHREHLTASKNEFQKYCEVLGIVVIHSTLYALQPVKKFERLNYDWEKVMGSFYSSTTIHNALGLEISSFTPSGTRSHSKVREWLLATEVPNNDMRTRLNELLSMDY